MNINKFTQKSIEAVNNCEKIAYDYGNQEIDQEHFLYSLMTIEDSLIANLIEKMDINKDTFIKKPHERVYFTHVRFLIFKKSQKIIRLSNQDATSCHFLPRIVLYLYLAQSQGIFFLCHHYDRH